MRRIRKNLISARHKLHYNIICVLSNEFVGFLLVFAQNWQDALNVIVYLCERLAVREMINTGQTSSSKLSVSMNLKTTDHHLDERKMVEI